MTPQNKRPTDWFHPQKGNDNERQRPTPTPEPKPPTGTPFPGLPHTETATGRPPKKAVQWQFLHGASQERNMPLGRMHGSRKPSNFPRPGTVQPVRPRTPPETGTCPKNLFSIRPPSLPSRCVFGLLPRPLSPTLPETCTNQSHPKHATGRGGNGKTTDTGGRSETRLRRLRPPGKITIRYKQLQYQNIIM